MTVDALLVQLACLDVVLSVEGERILFDAPAGVLTPQLRATIASHRGDLIRRLSAESAAAVDGSRPPPGAGTPVALPPRRCPAHIDPRQWVDGASVNGRIRTTCRLCGGFIGYRPALHWIESKR